MQSITIQPIDSFAELQEVEELQKEVWGCADRDVVPLTLLLASREVGAVLIGAYDGPNLIGFVYGFPGYEAGCVTHHSHMLAVKPGYRNHDLGYKLKLAQREAVLKQGIDRITWTFDPLQSLNAYLNFAKLGVIANTYKINFYGEVTSSFLHQFGTDRLWVTWSVDSERVRQRLKTHAEATSFELDGVLTLVNVGPENAPQRNMASTILNQKRLVIEIPSDINELQRHAPRLAIEWREVTRWAFGAAMAQGYFVEEFYRARANHQSIGRYLLSYGR